jgi:hypothetical protein
MASRALDFPELAETAAGLLADARRSGRESAIAVAEAIAADTAAVVAHRDLPPSSVPTATIRTALAGAVTAAQRRLEAQPRNEAAAVHARRIADLAYAWRGGDGTDATAPLIHFCHRINQQIRAEAQQRKGAA